MRLTRFAPGLVFFTMSCANNPEAVREAIRQFAEVETPKQIAPRLTVSLDGKPVTSTLEFGSRLLGTRSKRSLTLTNHGARSAMYVWGEFEGSGFDFPGGFPGEGGDCGDSLAGNASCSIVIQFSPQQAVEHRSSLLFSFQDGEEVLQARLPVTGKVSQLNAVSLGGGHLCAIDDAGEVKCWGSNSHRQAGDPEKRDRKDSATSIPLPDSARAVSTGGNHSCALLSDSTVRCWGENSFGETGGDRLGDSHESASAIYLGNKVTAVSTGFHHSCALLINGDVECWGLNLLGQLGAALGLGQSTVPLPVPGVHDAVALASGDQHSCAVRSNGDVVCWGANESGQLGQPATGTAEYSSNLVQAPVQGANRVIAGAAHTCAVGTDGSLRCWGENGSGQLGTGNFESSANPSQVRGIKAVEQAAAGGETTCIIDSAGTMSCWGKNDQGQLSDRDPGTNKPAPVYFDSSSDSVSVAVGRDTVCTLTENQTLECAGNASSGQMGSSFDGAISYGVQADVRDL